MTVYAPETPGSRRFDALEVSNTAELTPFLGSAVQRVVRLGDRFGVSFSTPALTYEQAGQWIAFLAAAKRDEAALRWREPGVRLVAYGSPLVAGGGQAGSSLNIDGLPAHCRIEAGKFFSVLSGGRRSLHTVLARTDANSSGAASLPIWPPLRFSPADNAVVELAKPYIQGLIAKQDAIYSIEIAVVTGVSFQLREAR